MSEPAQPAQPAQPVVDVLGARRRDRRLQLRWSAILATTLGLLGVPLGVLWDVLSPPGPLGVRLPAGIQADETEAFAAGDGRFAVIVVSVGIVAGAGAWMLKRVRGPLLAAALALGGVIGPVLTDLTGHLVRGEGPTTHASGALYYRHLPLQVHMTGLIVTEAVVALLIFALCTAFAVRDDLGRPDSSPVGAGDGPVSDGFGSVRAQRGLQDAGRDGDGAGVA